MRVRDWRIAFALLLLCGAAIASWGASTSTTGCETPLLPSHTSQASDDREFQNVYQCLTAPDIHNATISTATVTGAIVVPQATASNQAVQFSQVLGQRITQIKYLQGAATASTSGTSFTASNITVSITPLSAGATMFVLAFGNSQGSSSASAAMTLYRGANNLGNSVSGMAENAGNTGSVSVVENFSIFKIDSPNTTSSVTYTVYCPPPTSTTSSPDLGYSSIVVFEID